MNIPGFDSALSGMRASQKRLEASGHNVANVNSDTFKSQIVTQHEDKGLVETTISRDMRKGPEVTRFANNGEPEKIELSNVDLTKEITDQISSTKNYAANLKTIKTMDEVMGTIIDLKK